MISAIHRKMAIVFFIGFIIIFMYDVVSELFVWLVHISFELIEYSLELLIEHIFHTNHHQSEIILVDLLIIIALCILYWLWRILPRLKRNLIAKWMKQKKLTNQYWHTLATVQKIQQVTVYTIGLISILFFI